MTNSGIPKKNVKATAKILYDLNFSAKYISETLGIHRTSVYRYARKPLPEDLIHFATEIKGLYLIKQQLLMAKCFDQLERLLPIQTDIKDIIAAIKVFLDNINNAYPNTSSQVNTSHPTSTASMEEVIKKNEEFYEALHKTGKYAGSSIVDSMLPTTN